MSAEPMDVDEGDRASPSPPKPRSETSSEPSSDEEDPYPIEHIDLRYDAYYPKLPFVGRCITFGERAPSNHNVPWTLRGELDRLFESPTITIESVIFDEEEEILDTDLHQLIQLELGRRKICLTIESIHFGPAYPYLNIVALPDITDEGLAYVVDACPRLTDLAVMGANLLTDLGVHLALDKGKALKSFAVSTTETNVENPPTFAILLCRLFQAFGVENMPDWCPRLRRLKLIGYRHIDERLVESVTARRRNLEITFNRWKSDRTECLITYHDGRRVLCV